VNSFSVALNFFVGPFISFGTVLAMMAGMSVTGVGLVFVMDKWFAKMDEPEPKEEVEVALNLISTKPSEKSVQLEEDVEDIDLNT